MKNRGRFTRVVSVVFLATLAIMGQGCSLSVKRSSFFSSTSSLTPGLVKHLPNLAAMDLQACNYTIDTRTKSGLVPLPFDTRNELRGSAELSEAGWERLKSTGKWKPVSRNAVSSRLLKIVPSGEILASRDFDKSFSANSTYCKGAAVILADGDSRRVFFLATDRYHPVQ